MAAWMAANSSSIPPTTIIRLSKEISPKSTPPKTEFPPTTFNTVAERLMFGNQLSRNDMSLKETSRIKSEHGALAMFTSNVDLPLCLKPIDNNNIFYQDYLANLIFAPHKN